MKTTELISHEELLELLEYRASTGVFIWKVYRAGTAKAGDVAGSLTTKGYLHITINSITYQAHRLAWFYVYKEWPPEGMQIDHINRNKQDNRIDNLRLVTNAQNQCNNACLGISRDRQRWKARITTDGVTQHLGTFDCPLMAGIARLEAKERLHSVPLNSGKPNTTP